VRRISRNRHGGRLVICTAADPQPIGVRLNRYSSLGKVVGVCFYFGGQRYLSWVWPIVYQVQNEDRRLRWFVEGSGR